MDKRDASATVDLKVRMKEPLRARLQAAAEEHGVSMNAEAVARLDRSFDQQDHSARLDDLYHGSEVTGFLMLVEEAMTSAGRVATTEQGKAYREWLRDPYAFDQAVKAFLFLAERLRPAGDVPPADHVIELPDGSTAALSGRAGSSAAMTALMGVAAASEPDADRWTKAVRERLGSLADRLLLPAAAKKREKAK